MRKVDLNQSLVATYANETPPGLRSMDTNTRYGHDTIGQECDFYNRKIQAERGYNTFMTICLLLFKNVYPFI